jgi:hypothetical protein
MKQINRYIMEAPPEAHTALAILRVNTDSGSAFNVTAFKGEPSNLEVTQMLAAAFVSQLQVMASSGPGDLYEITLLAAIEHHLSSLERLHSIVGAMLQHRRQIDDMLLSGLSGEEIIQAIQEGATIDEEE